MELDETSGHQYSDQVDSPVVMQVDRLSGGSSGRSSGRQAGRQADRHVVRQVVRPEVRSSP